MNLTALSIRRPVTILMILGFFVLFGLVAFTKLPVRRLPNVNYPFIRVVIGDPGANATTVNQTITTRVENALSSETGIVSMVGTSGPGRSQVAIQFVGGTNIDQKAASVALALEKIARGLPPTASAPSIIKANPNALPMMNIALYGPLASSQLYNLATTVVAPTIQEIPGVAQVAVVGGRPQVVNVIVHPSALAAYGLSFPQVLAALKAQNVAVSGGVTVVGQQQLVTKTTGGYPSLAALASLPIASRAGGAVLLDDVATVEPGLAQAQSEATLNGHPAVGLVVSASSTANSLAVDTAIRSALARLQTQLPAGVRTAITGDITNYTRAALTNVEFDLVMGIVMAGLVLLIFLRRLANTLIVMVAIPFSLVSTFAVMYFLGFSLDLISLMALSLLIGILVDDSIVVLENIHRHLAMGKDPATAAIDGRMEIGAAAVAITLTDVVVYAPVAFVSGNIGQLFREFGLTIVAATLFSLLVSYTLTPMLAARWSGPTFARARPGLWGRWGDRFDAGFDRLRALYRRVIAWALDHRLAMLGVAAAAFLATAFFAESGVIPTTFVPREDNGVFTINARFPTGTSLAQSQQVLQQLGRRIQKLPGVTTVFISSGYGGGLGAATNVGQITVDLAARGTRPSIYTYVRRVNQLARRYPGLQAHAHVQNPLVIAGARAASVTLLGPQLLTVEHLASEVANLASHNPALTEVSTSITAPTPELSVSVNHAEAAYLGVSTATVGQTILAALGHAAVPPIVPSSTVPDILVQLQVAGSPYLTPAQIGQIPISTAHGIVPLDAVAQLRETYGANSLTVINREYAVSVSASSASGNVGPAENALVDAVHEVGLPTGYSYQLGGEALQQQRSFGPMVAALGLSILLLYMLLAALYESLIEPLAILLSLPLATVGAFLGLWIARVPLSIFALLAMIMLMGLVGKNAILLIDYAKTLQKRGQARNRAVIESGATRIRPILMTTATMVGAMLPLAISHGAGSSERIPVAVVLIGGMTSSTVLTLLVVPVLYTVVDDIGRLVRRVVRRPLSREATSAPLG
jgi:HAE1 family hydrophobic/amphiphilic exporter-1